MRLEEALKASPVKEAWRPYYTDNKDRSPDQNRIVIARMHPGVIYFYVGWEDTGKEIRELGGVELGKRTYGFEDWTPTQL